MLYNIGLTITQEYDGSADAGRHLLRVSPAELPGEQRLLRHRLVIDPPTTERMERFDFFGNAAVEVAFRSPHEKIAFRMEARVQRLAHPPSLDISPELPRLSQEVADVRHLEPRSPHHFLGNSPRVPLHAAMTEYAQEQFETGITAFEAVRRVGIALHRDLDYDPDATHVNTPAAEAFERRHGVCQDFSHIMIACLRGVGIPAGYVSGFLRTIPPEGQERLEGADAMHAWVRAWCGFETGWIEYDPTNAQFVALDHIVVARGRDYGDVAPVKGVLRTAGDQEIDQAVDVVPLKGP